MSRIRIAAALAAGLLSLPGTAAATHETWPVPPRCFAQGVSTNARTMTLAVTLFAVPPAVPPLPHSAACHVYVNGTHVATIGGNHIGFVIVGHGVITLPIGPYSVCAEGDGHGCP